MGKIYKSAADLIGNTPLVEVGHIEEKFGLKARVLVKLEYFNAPYALIIFLLSTLIVSGRTIIVL